LRAGRSAGAFLLKTLLDAATLGGRTVAGPAQHHQRTGPLQLLLEATGLRVHLLHLPRHLLETAVHGLVLDGGSEDVVEMGAVGEGVESLFDLAAIEDDLLFHEAQTVLAALQVHLLDLVLPQQFGVVVTLLLNGPFQHALLLPDGPQAKV
jgi:hypothetical protein